LDNWVSDGRKHYASFKKLEPWVWVDVNWLGSEFSGGSYEHGNELSDFINGGK
jgi:hypothetical protein